MDIETVNQDGAVIVKVSGCLDTASVEGFRQVIDGIPAGVKKVTFEFSGVEFIASSVLRVMVMLGKRLCVEDGSIEVSGANEVVRDVFEMTGLVEVFKVI